VPLPQLPAADALLGNSPQPTSAWAGEQRPPTLLKDRWLPDPLPPMRDTFLHGLLGGQARHGGDLSPQAQSDLGFDSFLYYARGRVAPGSGKAQELFHRLVDLAHDNPTVLFRAVFFEQLDELLGPEFVWVQLPHTRTNAKTGRPW